MKVWIGETEWFPVPKYDRAADVDSDWCRKIYGQPVEVPDELIARYDAAEKAFNEVADELRCYEPDRGPLVPLEIIVEVSGA